MKPSRFQDTHSLLATTCQVNEVSCVNRNIATNGLDLNFFVLIRPSLSIHFTHCEEVMCTHVKLPHGSATLLGDIVDILQRVWNLSSSPGEWNAMAYQCKKTNTRNITVNIYFSFLSRFKLGKIVQESISFS